MKPLMNAFGLPGGTLRAPRMPIDDAELKATLSAAKPYKAWLEKTQIMLEDLEAASSPPRASASLTSPAA